MRVEKVLFRTPGPRIDDFARGRIDRPVQHRQQLLARSCPIETAKHGAFGRQNQGDRDLLLLAARKEGTERSSVLRGYAEVLQQGLILAPGTGVVSVSILRCDERQIE